MQQAFESFIKQSFDERIMDEQPWLTGSALRPQTAQAGCCDEAQLWS